MGKVNAPAMLVTSESMAELINWFREDESDMRDTITQKNKRRSVARRVRLEVLLRDKGVCRRCGVTPADLSTLHVHHCNRVADGGTDVLENLISLCVDCHKVAHKGDKRVGKHRKPPEIRRRSLNALVHPDTVGLIREKAKRLGVSQGRIIDAAVKSFVADVGEVLTSAHFERAIVRVKEASADRHKRRVEAVSDLTVEYD